MDKRLDSLTRKNHRGCAVSGTTTSKWHIRPQFFPGIPGDLEGCFLLFPRLIEKTAIAPQIYQPDFQGTPLQIGGYFSLHFDRAVAGRNDLHADVRGMFERIRVQGLMLKKGLRSPGDIGHPCSLNSIL